MLIFGIYTYVLLSALLFIGFLYFVGWLTELVCDGVERLALLFGGKPEGVRSFPPLEPHAGHHSLGDHFLSSHPDEVPSTAPPPGHVRARTRRTTPLP